MTSISVQTPFSSLISLGVSAGDVAALWSYGRKFGSFVSTASADKDFLAILDTDDATILRRTGLFDPLAWNKRWTSQLNILANGKPETFKDERAQSVYEENPTRFTQIMISVTAVLLPFTSGSALTKVLSKFLKRLLATSDDRENFIDSQRQTLVRAWVSSGIARGLVAYCRSEHSDLIKTGLSLPGLIPDAECEVVADFFYWLFGTKEEQYCTNSSDVLAMALLLQRLGFDTLSAERLPEIVAFESHCQVVYTEDPLRLEHIRVLSNGNISRNAVHHIQTPVSLFLLEESFNTFPISYSVANSARQSWLRGAKAAESVRLSVTTDRETNSGLNDLYKIDDLRYRVQDLGSDAQRIQPKVYPFAESFLAINKEVCKPLEQILELSSGESISWLQDNLIESNGSRTKIQDSEHVLKEEQIHIFCNYQAFLLGYFYFVLLPLLDVSGLRLKVVDGSWGYRETELLDEMRSLSIRVRREKSIPRETLLNILGKFFLGAESPQIPATANVETNCIGVIGTRTLLCNSLIKHCTTPDEISGFTLLDVDTSGIPRDYCGLIRPGIVDTGIERTAASRVTPSKDVRLRGPNPDLSRHIEPDWEGNTETILLVMRYKGRRIGSLNPALTDVLFCFNYVNPVHLSQEGTKPVICERHQGSPLDHQILPQAIECGLEDLLQGRILDAHKGIKAPVIIQALGRPGMRYAAAGWLGKHRFAVSSDCVHAAIDSDQGRSNTVII